MAASRRRKEPPPRTGHQSRGDPMRTTCITTQQTRNYLVNGTRFILDDYDFSENEWRRIVKSLEYLREKRAPYKDGSFYCVPNFRYTPDDERDDGDGESHYQVELEIETWSVGAWDDQILLVNPDMTEKFDLYEDDSDEISHIGTIEGRSS